MRLNKASTEKSLQRCGLFLCVGGIQILKKKKPRREGVLSRLF
jgi:hypothetical protein